MSRSGAWRSAHSGFARLYMLHDNNHLPADDYSNVVWIGTESSIFIFPLTYAATSSVTAPSSCHKRDYDHSSTKQGKETWHVDVHVRSDQLSGRYKSPRAT